MSVTDTTAAALTAVPVSLPPAQLKFLDTDGTVSLPWRRFLQQLYARTGGGVDQIATGQNTLTEAVSSSSDDVAQAVSDAAAALAATELSELLGLVDLRAEAAPPFAPPPVQPDPPMTPPLSLVELLGLQALEPGAKAALAILAAGVQKTAAARSLNFTGSVTVVDDGAGGETIAVAGGSGGGYLPLVNGTVPFLGLMHGPDGQTIGVPIS